MKPLDGEETGGMSPEPAFPSLPKEELHEFIRAFFNRRERFLDLIQKHGSPAYVLDVAALRERAERFQAAFRAELPDPGFFFAMKSNNLPEISRRLLETGFGLDVSSGLELETALDLGAGEIVFSGPGKTDRELELAARNSGVVTVLLDSFGELHRLEKTASSFKTRVRAGVRLTTNPNGLWRKFGIPSERLGEFITTARTFSHVDLKGLQFHTSWNRSAEAQVDFIHHLGGLLASLPRDALSRLEFIDIGGGYWPEQGEWLQPAGVSGTMPDNPPGRKPSPARIPHRLQSDPIGEFARDIGQAVREDLFSLKEFRICLEPGRWVCNDGMHLFITVVDKKAEDLVITDAGTNTIGWERYETDYCPVLNLDRPDLTEQSCLILGSLCTPHDVWGYGYFGREIRENDVLMIPCQGAYTYSLRQNFIKPIPEVVIME